MWEGLREIGRGMAGFGKWLLVVILAHGLVLTGFFALGLGGLWAMGSAAGLTAGSTSTT
jgi:hypothetical protein